MALIINWLQIVSYELKYIRTVIARRMPTSYLRLEINKTKLTSLL